MKTKPKKEKIEIDMEFRDNFSFGSYLDLVQRVEYLEGQLKGRGVVGRKYAPGEFTGYQACKKVEYELDEKHHQKPDEESGHLLEFD